MTSMTCEALVELVTDHLESALDPQTEQRLRDHLALCDGCERYLDQIRHTVDMLRTPSTTPRPSHGRGVPLLDRPPELTALDGS
jgi:predicted anti-sigma-YlaC factor YlaD